MTFKNFSATVVSKSDLAKDTFLLTVKTSEPIDFLGGQYFSFKIMDRINRSYSIASAPGNELVEFVVDIAPGGPGSVFVENLKIGESFNAMGPFGFFNLENTKAMENEDSLIFVATGTGIAPMRSMILDLLKNKKSTRNIQLYYGMRYENEAYFFDEFSELEMEFPNFKFVPIISRPTENWKGAVGYCQDIISKSPVVAGAKVYICGRTETVKSIAQALIDHGYPKEVVFYEKFG